MLFSIVFKYKTEMKKKIKGEDDDSFFLSPIMYYMYDTSLDHLK